MAINDGKDRKQFVQLIQINQLQTQLFQMETFVYHKPIQESL